MKTQSINCTTPVAFGALRRNPLTMSKSLFNTVSEYPAVKEFGKKYDAQLSVGVFLSSKNPARKQLALQFEDIKPKSFIEKVKNTFSKRLSNDINLKTHATNENDFLVEIAEQKADTIFNIYKKSQNVRF